MATLYIREDELGMAGERLSEVASEMTNPTLSECAAAESLAMPGGQRSRLRRHDRRHNEALKKSYFSHC